MAVRKFNLDQIPKYASAVLMAATDYAKANAAINLFRRAHPRGESRTPEVQSEDERLLKDFREKKELLERTAKKYRF